MPLQVGITGNRGFMAGHLAEHLSQQAHGVHDLDPHLEGTGAKLPKTLDAVFHLAAKSDIQKAFLNPASVLENNLQCLIKALCLAQKSQSRFVFFSSYVYGHPKTIPITEDHPQDSLNPYMGSKILGENICKEFCRWNKLPLVILRPFSIYGKGMREGRLVSDLIQQAIKGGPLQIRSPEPVRDYLYIEDLCLLCERILHTPLDPDENPTFNVGSGFQCSNLELAKKIKELAGLTEEIIVDNIDRKADVFEVIPCLEKVKKRFGWSPSISLEEGLLRMLKVP